MLARELMNLGIGGLCCIAQRFGEDRAGRFGCRDPRRPERFEDHVAGHAARQFAGSRTTHSVGDQKEQSMPGRREIARCGLELHWRTGGEIGNEERVLVVLPRLTDIRLRENADDDFWVVASRRFG